MFKKKNCKYCKTEYQPTKPSHLYCSKDCSQNGLIENYYQNVYKISFEDVRAMLAAQGGVCAICKDPGFNMNEYVRSPLNVDHCHETNIVRGFLCHNCNRGLGLFKDNIERLKTAIAYLEGATTISKESTYKCTEAHDTRKE